MARSLLCSSAVRVHDSQTHRSPLRLTRTAPSAVHQAGKVLNMPPVHHPVIIFGCTLLFCHWTIIRNAVGLPFSTSVSNLSFLLWLQVSQYGCNSIATSMWFSCMESDCAVQMDIDTDLDKSCGPVGQSLHKAIRYHKTIAHNICVLYRHPSAHSNTTDKFPDP